MTWRDHFLWGSTFLSSKTAQCSMYITQSKYINKTENKHKERQVTWGMDQVLRPSPGPIKNGVLYMLQVNLFLRLICSNLGQFVST